MRPGQAVEILEVELKDLEENFMKGWTGSLIISWGLHEKSERWSNGYNPTGDFLRALERHNGLTL